MTNRQVRLYLIWLNWMKWYIFFSYDFIPDIYIYKFKSFKWFCVILVSIDAQTHIYTFLHTDLQKLTNIHLYTQTYTHVYIMVKESHHRKWYSIENNCNVSYTSVKKINYKHGMRNENGRILNVWRLLDVSEMYSDLYHKFRSTESDRKLTYMKICYIHR